MKGQYQYVSVSELLDISAVFCSQSNLMHTLYSNRAVVLYNSLTTTREQVVSLHISDPAVMVCMIIKFSSIFCLHQWMSQTTYHLNQVLYTGQRAYHVIQESRIWELQSCGSSLSGLMTTLTTPCLDTPLTRIISVSSLLQLQTLFLPPVGVH